MFKNILFVYLFVCLSGSMQALTLKAELFDYNKEKVNQAFAGLDKLEQFLIENPDLSHEDIVFRFPQYAYLFNSKYETSLDAMQILSSENIHSFWWAFSFSFIGSYFIYGAAAGPIVVAIIYYKTNKNKTETKKAIYGCLTGTVLGLGIRYMVSNL